MGKLTIILGGARSGKSTFAEKLAHDRSEEVLYLATALPDDPEMKTRIERHRTQRPSDWKTREISQRISDVFMEHPPQEDTVLLDCVTMLVSNVILEACGSIDEPDEQASEAAVFEEIHQLLDLIRRGEQNWILVSNEVGMGLVPPYPLGRIYRDLLGWTNKQLTAAAQESFLMFSGKVIPLHDVGTDMKDYLSGDD